MWKNIDMLASGYSLDAVNIVVRDHERDGSLEVHLFYADDVFDANYRFTDALRHVLTLIDRALEAPDMPLDQIDMLSDADRTELETFASERRSMLDLAWSATVDRLAADIPVNALRWCQRT